jgi:hypothetical protein
MVVALPMVVESGEGHDAGPPPIKRSLCFRLTR